MPINSSVLRLTWAVIEETSPKDLLTSSDTALVKLLSQHVTQKIALSGEDVRNLYAYLGSKVSLIRDIAETRLIQETQPSSVNLHQPASQPAFGHLNTRIK